MAVACTTVNFCVSVGKTLNQSNQSKTDMKLNKTILSLVLAGLSGVAYANPTGPGLYLVDTANPLADVFIPISGGAASYSGVVGSWTVGITTGTTISGGASPVLDLNINSAVAGAGGGQLVVLYSDINFGPTVGTATLTSSGSITSGSVNVTAGFNTGSTAFGDFSNLAGLGPLAGMNFSGSTTALLNSLGSQYVLTFGDLISANPGAVITGLDTHISFSSVPDSGMTLVLLGAGLVALGFFAWVRKEQVQA